MVTAVDEAVVNDVFATPEIAPPPQEADAHRATITSVTSKTFDSGAVKVEVNLSSIDGGFDTQYGIFPPKDVLENWEAVMVEGNTDVLSDVPAPGKKQSAKQRYGAIFASTKKDAEFQRLRAIAAEQGATLADSGYTAMPDSFEGFVEAHNKLLIGKEVVFVRKPRKDENPQYDGKLEVSRLYPISSIDNPKLFRGIVKRWE